MSTKLKVILVAFISLISIATWSFAEEVQGQAEKTVKDSSSVVKPEAGVKKTKVAKVKKEKKPKKKKKETKANK
jgi:hypothetical protein